MSERLTGRLVSVLDNVLFITPRLIALVSAGIVLSIVLIVCTN